MLGLGGKSWWPGVMETAFQTLRRSRLTHTQVPPHSPCPTGVTVFSLEMDGMLTRRPQGSQVAASQMLPFPEPPPSSLGWGSSPHTSGHPGVGKHTETSLHSPTFNPHTPQGLGGGSQGREGEESPQFFGNGGWGFTRSHLLKSKKVIIMQRLGPLELPA